MKATPNPPKRMSLSMRHRNWERFLFVIKFLLLVGLLILQVRVPDIHIRMAVPSRYVQAVLLLITVHLCFDFARIIITAFYIRRNKLPYNVRDNFTLGINQIASIGSIVGFVLALLLVFDIHPREALTAISIVAAAMAILFKDYVSNLLNGMIILFSDEFSLEDRIKIGQYKGIIVDITLLNVHLLSDDDELIYVPNNTVLGSDVVNYTKRAPDKSVVEFEIPYTHLKNIPDLESWLLDSLKHFPDYVIREKTSMKIASVLRDAVILKLQYARRGEADRDMDRSVRKYVLQRVVDYIEQKPT
ncbi:MAG: hypothetical protein EAZ89_01320 [Bacteroidetes bacterium]|nr:MAG: hypothetical protein EAZ89_01320 [Bacteroidota bacterium]